ncbi:DUF4405 domain-containing protein [uncultured Sutterella sp.]|uniref:DUF4405 domain-containing protein n=1 Tax=uncultured Sutterella sp. TaxID=286133 RepID=UPI0025D2FD47|nr:DUF4405 domain-containing protein [uncultured Sutterella sp.]
MMKQFLPEDPGRLWLLRIRFDRFLFLMLFAIMMDRYTLNPVHEVLGVAAILAFGLHAWANRNWYSGILRQVLGKSKVRRKKPGIGRWCVIALNLLLTLLFIASIVSGIMASQSLFAWATPDEWRMDLDYRTAHVALSVWAWFLAAIHLGLNWEVVFPGIAGKRGLRLAMGALGVLAVLLAPLAFMRREVDLMLEFQSAYIPVELEELPGLMPLDCLLLFVGTAASAAFLRTGFGFFREALKGRP